MSLVSQSGSREHCLSFKLIRIPNVGEEVGDGKGRVNPPKTASRSSTKTAAASSSSSDATLSLSPSLPSPSLPPKKRRYVLYADILDDDSNHHQEEGHLALAARPSSKYMCRTCGKAFPTGQALGGHQTAHRPRPKSAPSPDQESDQRAPPRILDFDLNELPPYS